jgi:ribosomal protein S18 acetylase RimI-like enzyme
MSLQIRKATLKDLHKIVAMYGHVGDSPHDPFASVRRLRRLNLDSLLIAESQGDFAGFLYYFIYKHPYFEPGVQDYASIDELHVKRRFWNRGIGSTLLHTALEEISEKGISTVYVDTDEDNYRALHVYRKIGFKDMRRSVKLKLVLK